MTSFLYPTPFLAAPTCTPVYKRPLITNSKLNGLKGVS